jgi:hypothetical protein
MVHFYGIILDGGGIMPLPAVSLSVLVESRESREREREYLVD